jgi:hypothetical protein
MKKQKIKLTAIFILFASILFAQENINFRNMELANKVVHNNKSVEVNKFSINEDKKEKSPYLGALFSAVIPGAGEFYAKSYIKSAIFFAVEVGLWTVYGIYQKKGNNQTDYFQNYANTNWDIRKYARWLKDQSFQGSSGINPDEQNIEVLRAQLNVCEEQNFSHTLPAFGEQQYYEVIGKYQNFISGWSTAGADITKNNYEHYVLPQVQNYMSDRQKANDYFDWASRSVDVIILNHILSAADAAWSVSLYNKQLQINTQLNFRNVYSSKNNKYNLTPFANIRINF